MREIEFRIKDKITKQWFYGMPLSPILEKKDTCIFKSGDGVYFNVFAKVDTLGQYTGLKDKNGTKIFEGDYILYEDKCKDFSVHEIGFIKYEDAKFVIEIITDNEFGDIPLNNDDSYSDNISKIVIGNVYDNPELLGDKENE